MYIKQKIGGSSKDTKKWVYFISRTLVPLRGNKVNRIIVEY